MVVLSKKLAVVLEYGANRLGAPQAISGVIVAILLLCPEGVSSIRAALGNRLQRSVNLIFGAALSTIALTVPAVVVEWFGKLAMAAGFESWTFEKLRDRNIKWKNRKHRVPLCEGHLWVRG